MDSEKRGYINIKKVPPQMTLQKETWETHPNTVQILTEAVLAYLLIPVKTIKFEKFTLSDMENLKSVC